MSNELLEAYKAIALLFLRDQITREERDARIVASRDTPMAAGLTFEERDALANKAVWWAAEILDEIYFAGSTWQ